MRTISLTGADPLVDNGGYNFSTVTFDATNDEIDVNFVRELIGASRGGKYIPLSSPYTGAEPQLDMDVAWTGGTAVDNFATMMFVVLATAPAALGAGVTSPMCPAFGVNFTWDTDDAASKSVRGIFWNAAGTAHTTAWTSWGATGSTAKKLRAWVSGAIGYFSINDGVPVTVALAGDFSGTYDTWTIPPRSGGGDDNTDAQQFSIRRIAAVDLYDVTHGVVLG